jgi:hypothetical protein
VGVALRAEAEHGEGFVPQHGEVRVLVVINFGRHGLFMINDLQLMIGNPVSGSM